MVAEHRFDRIESFTDPVPHPKIALGLRAVEFAVEKLHHAQVAQRMDVACDCHGNRADALPIARRHGKQRWLGPGLVEVFKNGQRLPELATAMLQDGNHALRVDRAEFRPPLVAAIAQEMDRKDVVTQTLEIQADAHAIRRAGAPIRVQLQQVAHDPPPRKQAVDCTGSCAVGDRPQTLPLTPPVAGGSCGGRALHALLDRAENAPPRGIQHLDAHHVAE